MMIVGLYIILTHLIIPFVYSIYTVYHQARSGKEDMVDNLAYIISMLLIGAIFTPLYFTYLYIYNLGNKHGHIDHLNEELNALKNKQLHLVLNRKYSLTDPEVLDISNKISNIETKLEDEKRNHL